MKGSVVYLGPPSSYTHQAALSAFDKAETSLEPEACISDVFQAVQSGSVKYGVVPFENSTNGAVMYTLDLLLDREKCCPDVNVCGEAYINVHHCLLGHSKGPSKPDDVTDSGTTTPTIDVPNPKSPRAHPLSDLGHIKRIYSHPQAFGQCEAFLSTYLRGVERQEVTSTSKAAEIVATDPSRTTAAISNRLAADVHRLKFLAEDIEDREDNMTRFLILQKSISKHGVVPTENLSTNGVEHQKDWKSLLAFQVDRQCSDALAKALSVFGLHDLNLTSINSRPSREYPWHYIFLVEFSDRRDGKATTQINLALEDLSKCTQNWRWLGTWVDKGCKAC